MSEDEYEAGSLRERKRLETRNSISQAALQLTLEHDGLQHVTPDEIAERAGVSPRTFHNYFHSREAALGALPGDRARRVALAFSGRPAEEPFADALAEAVVAEYTLGGQEPDKANVHKLRAIMADGGYSKEALRKVMAEEGARPHFLESMRQLEEQLIPVIGERLGLDPNEDLLPRIVAAAVNGAVRVATRYWLRDDVDAPYTALLRQAVRTAAALADQPPFPFPDQPRRRASLSENENP
ncbi:TetR family transcriptional regulator [Catenulispora sp. NF23]|uniref:TetR family transcriptional regulator n=1 Tax=Catenulispora pinistramenti TaxID=2705254 RepID=A0ABS5KWF0_9ACTN|nr:TetR family transcriptional regulator [Catenulispora pinistramenti]MBS2535894.1 TetR family transcriptional regulator [Catenulispora pinistramenti]MBS2550401.1 TetR family transcriptional regulator [Catenulispora pinistramenti]